jgi:hypothetical protein
MDDTRKSEAEPWMDVRKASTIDRSASRFAEAEWHPNCFAWCWEVHHEP